jgi:hypothetical protein
MSTYKPFYPSDIIISPFKVNKTFTFKGLIEFNNPKVGIDIFTCYSPNSSIFVSGSDLTGNISFHSKELLYKSIQQLYYSNYILDPQGSPVATASFNTDGTITGERHTPNYYNYPSTTLNLPREFPTGSSDLLGIISIPSNLFGENIKPLSFSFNNDQGYFSDNGEGKIIFSSSIYNVNDIFVGDIIYEHGLVIINKNLLNGLDGYGYSIYGNPPSVYGGIFNSFFSGSNITCSFNSTMTIYETQYKCSITEQEFNLSLNPTLLTGSKCDELNSTLRNFATGSLFSPYISTIGLYNNNYDLIAVAKLSQPLNIPTTTDLNIIINLDI